MRITLVRTIKLLVFCIFCFITFMSNVRIGISNPKFAVRDVFFDTMKIYTVGRETHVAFAMLDERKGNMGGPSVRLLTMASAFRSKLFCKFQNGDVVNATFYEFSENHMQHYGTYYVSCVLPSSRDYSLEFIEVSTSITDGWHTIPISYKIPDVVSFDKYANTYSICVPKLFGDGFSAERFIEFVELNRLLGADRIVLYVDKHNISSKLNQTFNHYGNEGILKIRDIRLPFNEKMIWYHAQLITITDCLVRHTGKSKFVAFHDLDEFLVPLKTRRVPDYLEEALKGNVSSIRVKTSYIQLDNDVAPITTRNIRAELVQDSRLTKCVLRPEHVFEQGIHHTSRVIQDYMKIISGEYDHISLFHYKSRKSNTENSHLASTYGNELEKNFKEVVSLLKL